MKQLHTVGAIRDVVQAAQAQGDRIGCVMTMGALHAGHRALLDAARDACDVVIATIFVNPTQFAPHEDLAKYPRPLEADLALCKDAGVDAVFLPDVETMYPPGAQTTVTVADVSQPLEGASRPTHFQGVATVVLKLLNITRPHVAFFGQKDYQQVAVIRQMVRDLNVPVEIATVPTVRDVDGLALSSRNQYLSPAERIVALRLNAALSDAEERLQAGETDIAAVTDAMVASISAGEAASVDYAVIADPETLQTLSTPQEQMVALVAARVGTTRLIDNRLMTVD